MEEREYFHSVMSDLTQKKGCDIFGLKVMLLKTQSVMGAEIRSFLSVLFTILY